MVGVIGSTFLASEGEKRIVDDLNLELMPSEDEDESSKISDNKGTLHQTSTAETVTLAAAGDDAVTADDSLARADKSEESVEAIKVMRNFCSF